MFNLADTSKCIESEDIIDYTPLSEVKEYKLTRLHSGAKNGMVHCVKLDNLRDYLKEHECNIDGDTVTGNCQDYWRNDLSLNLIHLHEILNSDMNRYKYFDVTENDRH